MKKKLKIIMCLAIAVITLISSSSIALAERLGTGKISGGANNILYWRDSSIYEYKDSVDQGFAYWNGHLSTVSLSRTTTKSYSRCDVYWGTYGFPPLSQDFARTDIKLNNQTITDYNQDWFWCEVWFNSNRYNYTGMPNFADRKGTACHEYGHFLGLAHPYPSITATIMQKYGTRTTQVPTAYDFGDLTNMYGQ